MPSNTAALRKVTETALWERGELSWMLRPHQVPLYEQIKAHLAGAIPTFVLCVCRRFGKTTVLLLIALEQCLQLKNQIVRFVAPQLKDAREIANEIIRPLLEPARIAPQYNAVDSIYKFSNGSRVYVTGCNGGHEDDSRGRRADLVIVDEAGFVDRLPYLVGSVLMPQLLDARRMGSMLLSSTPAETPAHPFQAFCEEARVVGNYANFTIDDNTYLTPEVKSQIIEECGGVGSTIYRREFLTEFVVEAERAVVPEWIDVREVCTRDVEKDRHYYLYDRYTSMDLGVIHFTVILFATYHFRTGILAIEKEEFLRGSEVRSDRIAQIIKDGEKALWPNKPYSRVSDNDQLILLNDLNAMHGLYIRPTNKDNLHAMVNDMRLWIKARRVVVSPACTMLLGCLDGAIWDLKRKGWDASKAYGHYDALAALMYLVRNIDESHNPIPVELGLSGVTMWVNPEELARQQQLRNKLSKLTGNQVGN